PSDGEPLTVRAHFTAEDAGPHTFRFRIPPQEGEAVPENNHKDALVEVRDRREKVLYLEGEPRFEVKFLRRAVADDENLQLVVLQRTAEGKFLRLDVDSGDELAAGFPTTREELFQYSGLILGSVEASFFTGDQLRMIAEFAGERGGGLLALGGRRALAEGGYAGTPVADALPVRLNAQPSPETFAELEVRPTPAGALHAAVRLEEDEDASAARWAALPAVSTVNRVGALKPGATALLAGRGRGIEQPVLAFQRYGRGKALALPVQDSWIWQMHADVPLGDDSHETFWRQLLRWLVDGVPDPVSGALGSDRIEPGEALIVTATVDDAAHLAVNDARVTATVVAPSGAESEAALEWTVEKDGEYRARVPALEAGTYQVRVAAERDGTPLGGDTVYARAEPSDAEYFDAALRRPLLERIADETGGRFYTLEDVDRLPFDTDYTAAGLTVQDELELWDMPILFLLLVGMLGAEWAYRRKRGLP
ncbi:MAG TPA: FixH family protein, partial [Longimicrobiales bacterium]|nr:FixH family protein [Longimicrobiales bacterium]